MSSAREFVYRLLTSTGPLRRVKFYAALVGLYSLLPVLKEYSRYADFGDHPATSYSYVSLVLGLLLGFRTNSAYERWWEARKLWGKLVNVSRNLAIKAVEIVRPERKELRSFADLLTQFACELRDHLRRACRPPVGKDADSLPAHRGHVPAYISQRVYEQLARWRQGERFGEAAWPMLDAEARELMEICGGCERIQKTPLSPSYRVFLHQCVLVLLLLLPWGLISDLGIWTIPLSMVQAYVFLGLEAIARVIEDPFGHDEDDLDLDGICRAIETSVNEVVGTDA
jgi:putative membrane protein